jgi:hypothetical protein
MTKRTLINIKLIIAIKMLRIVSEAVQLAVHTKSNTEIQMPPKTYLFLNKIQT